MFAASAFGCPLPALRYLIVAGSNTMPNENRAPCFKRDPPSTSLKPRVSGECRRVVTENCVFFALSTLTQPNRRAIICDSPMLEGAQTSAVDRQSRCAQRRQTSQVKPRRAPHTKNQKQCVGCSRWTGHLDTPPATQTSRRHGLHNNGTHTHTHTPTHAPNTG